MVCMIVEMGLTLAGSKHRKTVKGMSSLVSDFTVRVESFSSVLYLKRDCVSETSGGHVLATQLARQQVDEVSSWYVVANIIAKALIFVSSCCNPFIYYISSRNFRESARAWGGFLTPSLQN